MKNKVLYSLLGLKKKNFSFSCFKVLVFNVTTRNVHSVTSLCNDVVSLLIACHTFIYRHLIKKM